MPIKKCTICKRPKDLNDFNKNKNRKDGRQSACKECNSKHSKKYYRKHKVAHRQKTKEQKKEIQRRNSQYIWDFLLMNPCLDCGETNPVVLEFDHVRGNKVAAVAVLSKDCWSLEKIQEEVNKCEVRCANCHRKKTALQLGWYKNINMGPSPNGMVPDF